MRRVRQSFEEIIGSLSVIEASWMDDHAASVMRTLRSFPKKQEYVPSDIEGLLSDDFDCGLTVVRLFLDVSKDEFTHRMREALGDGGIGVKRFRGAPAKYVEVLDSMGLCQLMTAAVNRPMCWSDLLVERLKAGRGSAIKGQARGRGLEDFVYELLGKFFRPDQIAARCRFTGAGGQSTEKADFAIPSAEDPAFLIEVKAYGATGSKQTDVLGDIARIVEEKRHDTALLLVTDGITWQQRPNDLRKLVALQNGGKIAKIYTMTMADELLEDLETLRGEFGLG